jgi:hypothetical protein
LSETTLVSLYTVYSILVYLVPVGWNAHEKGSEKK